MPKGHPRFTKPVEIQKQVGPCTHRLSDGKLTRVPDAAVMPADQRTQATEAAVMPTEQPLAGTSQPCTPERTMHDRVHPAREGKPQDWLKDYDIGDARTQDFALSF